MVDATIERGSGNFLSTGTTTLTLYQIQSEVIKKSAGLIRFPYPIADSYATILFDLLGVNRDIVVSGRVEVSDTTHLYKFARDLVSIKTINAQVLVSGNQGDTGNKVGFKYTPVSLNIKNDGTLDSGEVILVHVNDASVTYNAGNPNMLDYSLTMYEGSLSATTVWGPP